MTDTIETKRLVLRPYSRGDADRVACLLNNINVSRWLTHVPYPYTPADALEFFASSANSGGLVRAVCNADGLIGCVSIRSELGYWVGEPYWGCGYASEAAHALVTQRFNTTSDTLPASYLMGNSASKNVLEKLGFQPTQILSTYSVSQKVNATAQGMELTYQHWRAKA